MGNLKRVFAWTIGTTGLIVLMSAFMAGMTITTAANYRFSTLPAKWWLVVMSSMAAGAGLWALRAGPSPVIRFWCGLLWAGYAAIRSISWLAAGSWSGALPWVPCFLLGLAVFGRRNMAQYTGEHRERQA